MFEGTIYVDVFNEEKNLVKRARKSVKTIFQPYKGIVIETDLENFIVDEVIWNIENNTFTAWIFILWKPDQINYINELEICGWKVAEFEPVDSYCQDYINDRINTSK